MLNYTKGEWRIHPTHKTDVYALRDGSHFIAECGNPHLPNGEDLANAQLIASAPDMYEALKEIVSWKDATNVKFPTYAMGQAEKALAKAEQK